MVIPDWLAKIFQKLGWMTSGIDKLRQELAALEDQRREIKSVISKNIQELEKVKREYQAKYPIFAEAQEPEKGLLAIELRSLKSTIENGTAEISHLITSKVQVLDSLIATKKLEVIQAEHGSKTDEIENAIYVKEELAESLMEETSALKDLNSTSIISEPSSVGYADLEVKKAANNYDDLTPVTTKPAVKNNNDIEYKA